MKEIKAFKDALHHASNETAHYMTAHLRSEAHASGWPSHIIRNMHVSHEAGSFDVHVHDDHKNHAHELEYGTPDSRPTAAVRRFSNRTTEAEKFLVGRMSQMLGKL